MWITSSNSWTGCSSTWTGTWNKYIYIICTWMQLLKNSFWHVPLSINHNHHCVVKTHRQRLCTCYKKYYKNVFFFLPARINGDAHFEVGRTLEPEKINIIQNIFLYFLYNTSHMWVYFSTSSESLPSTSFLSIKFTWNKNSY